MLTSTNEEKRKKSYKKLFKITFFVPPGTNTLYSIYSQRKLSRGKSLTFFLEFEIFKICTFNLFYFPTMEALIIFRLDADTHLSIFFSNPDCNAAHQNYYT